MVRVTKTVRALALLSAIVIVATACRSSVELGESIARPEPTSSDAPTPDRPALDEIYSLVSQSIVFIETVDGTSGTGIVLEDGWILINAHVVERH